MVESMWQPKELDELVAAEMRHIGRAGHDPEALAGLALSGGGIRSASFALGVVQALEENRLIDRFDYLSTVSGGGYTGGAVTWLRHARSPKADAGAAQVAGRDNPPATPGNSPFARLLERFADYLRSRGNYLDPNQRLNALSLVGVVLRTMVINAAVYLGAAVIALRLLRLGDDPFRTLLELAVAGGAGLVAGSLYFGLRTGRSPLPSKQAVTRRYWLRTKFQIVFGRVLGVVIGLALVGSLPWAEAGIAWLSQHAGTLPAVGQGGTGFFGLVVGAVQALAQFRNAQAGKDSGSLTSGLALWLSAGLGLYGLLLVADVAARVLADGGAVGLAVTLALVLVVALLGLLANINMVTPHRMYRDRLMEAFMPSPVDMVGKKSEPATEANRTPLSAMCEDQGPLHLINTNLVLVDSDNTLYRGRGGDNFVLSPVLCGGDATGWAGADRFLGTGPDGLTLATAVAISGAAVNAHAGCAGQGAMRNALVSMLMTLFGLQLGYWVSRGGCMAATPNFLRPGGDALMGRNFKETASFLQLSDGGHFENLALYELVRRRVRTIVVSDAGADPTYRFDDLGNAIERVYADFGAVVRFDGDGLDRVVPRATGGYPGMLGLAAAGWVKGTVSYADGFVADLYYIKATLVPGLPDSIYAYKAANPDFPNQSTGDQFFDEAQLEAYRRLGYEQARSLSTLLVPVI